MKDLREDLVRSLLDEYREFILMDPNPSGALVAVLRDSLDEPVAGPRKRE